jgi:biotin transport system substrate-specific component
MAQARTLADRLMPGEGVAWDGARLAAANVLLVLCAWIALPLPWTPGPVTGQKFGVMLVGVLLGSRRGGLVLGLYLLEGLAGLPVFQPWGLPGAARLAGPTGGYLMAYPAAAFLTGWVVERGVNRASLARLVVALLAGELATFAGGCAWLAVALQMGWSAALALGVAPFAAGEVVKMALVVATVGGAERINKMKV